MSSRGFLSYIRRKMYKCNSCILHVQKSSISLLMAKSDVNLGTNGSFWLQVPLCAMLDECEEMGPKVSLCEQGTTQFSFQNKEFQILLKSFRPSHPRAYVGWCPVTALDALKPSFLWSPCKLLGLLYFTRFTFISVYERCCL